MELYLIGCSKEKEYGGHLTSSLSSLSFRYLLFNFRKNNIASFCKYPTQLQILYSFIFTFNYNISSSSYE
jgi:hypothetical protein